MHAKNQEYVLSEAGNLWRLLARITLNKLYSHVEKHTAARRNIHQEHEPDQVLPNDPASLEPNAAEVIALTEQLQLITKSLTPTEQSVLTAHLRGESIEIIAVAIQKSPRTVRRLLAQTRHKIEKQLIDDDSRPGPAMGTGVHRGVDPRAALSYSDFRLERLVGSGGMGKVYRATQHSTGRRVALKSLLKSRQADTNAVEKFLQEGEILASLNHPNIVRFQGIGRFPGGGYFIAMDFIDGSDLQSRIVTRPFTADEAVRIVGIVSRAIAHAHERGIVHGDIKPANILVDPSDRVHVTDFGLARFCGPSPAVPPWLIGGTAGYIAPKFATSVACPVPRPTSLPWVHFFGR